MPLTRGQGFVAGTGNAVTELVGPASKGIVQGFKSGNKATVKRIKKINERREAKASKNSEENGQETPAPYESTKSSQDYGNEMRSQIAARQAQKSKPNYSQKVQGSITAARGVAAGARSAYQRPNSSTTAPSSLDEAAKFAVKKSMLTHYKNQVNANLSALQHNADR